MVVFSKIENKIEHITNRQAMNLLLILQIKIRLQNKKG